MQKYKIHSEIGYKYRLKISKTGCLKFISHLDWQKLIYTTVRKSGLKVNYSQGFNPSPKISVGIALPLFIEGKNEIIDIEFQKEFADDIIKEKLNNILPENSQISEIVKILKSSDSIDKTICWAVYKAILADDSSNKNKKINIESIAKDFLLKENIIIEKPTKKGLKKINIKPSIYSLYFDKKNNTLKFTLKAGGGCVKAGGGYIKAEGGCIETGSCSVKSEGGCVKEEIEVKEELQNSENPAKNNKLLMAEKVSVSSLRADEFLRRLTPELDWKITREQLLDCNFNELI